MGKKLVWLPVVNLVAAFVTCALILNARDWALTPPVFARLLDIIARVSVAWFLLAFYTRPLNDLFHSKLTRFLMKNRRYIGLSFAAWFLQHLWILPLWGGPIFTKFWMAGRLMYATITVLLICAQTLTSFNAAQKWRGWKPLHWITMQANWVWFLAIYLVFWQKRGEPYQLVYIVLFFGGQLLRVAAFAKKRMRAAAPVAATTREAA